MSRTFKICSRQSGLKIAIQKSRRIRCLFERVLGAVPRSSILNKFRQSSIRKEHVRFKYFIGISAKREKNKEEICSEE